MEMSRDDQILINSIIDYSDMIRRKVLDDWFIYSSKKLQVTQLADTEIAELESIFPEMMSRILLARKERRFYIANINSKMLLDEIPSEEPDINLLATQDKNRVNLHHTFQFRGVEIVPLDPDTQLTYVVQTNVSTHYDQLVEPYYRHLLFRFTIIPRTVDGYPIVEFVPASTTPLFHHPQRAVLGMRVFNTPESIGVGMRMNSFTKPYNDLGELLNVEYILELATKGKNSLDNIPIPEDNQTRYILDLVNSILPLKGLPNSSDNPTTYLP